MFWDLTPCEIGRVLEGVRREQERQSETDLAIAYATVRLGRLKRLPSLDQLLQRSRSGKLQAPKPQSWQDMLKATERYVAQLK